MVQVNTTTTVETQTSVTNGLKLVVDSQSSTKSVGNYATDIKFNPYIAARTIGFYAKGMRPNQRVHAFFDSVLVDTYCAPGVLGSLVDTNDPNSISKTGSWGDALVTDGNGTIAGWFNIPGGTFKTGDRIFELADVTNLAQGNDAITTMSSAGFTASNMTVTTQEITLTTVNPEVTTRPISNTVVTTNTSVTIETLQDIIRPDTVFINAEYDDPIAQVFTINTPNREAGVFATSIDLYFKQKSQISTDGVKVYLCETVNGYPSGKKLPFSTVHLDYADVNVSADATTATTFTFESPVFLNNGVEYAVVIKPDHNNPDYWVYTADLFDTNGDITSGKRMFSQPIIGTAFYGATSTQWTALQTEYVKFELRIATFTASSGDAYFNNEDMDYLTLYNVAYTNTSAAMMPGDYVFKSTNSSPNTACTAIQGRYWNYDNTTNHLYVSNSTGSFPTSSFVQVHRFANDSVITPNTTTIIASGNTGAFFRPKLDAILPHFAVLNPAGTKVTYDFKGTSNSYVVDTAVTTVVQGNITEFYDKERILVGKSDEVASMSGVKSSNLHIKLMTDSLLLSPLIDTVKASGEAIGYEIDPVGFVYEEYLTSGASKSKYVSTVVTLAAGQDAQDLQVTVTAHKPPGTDVLVYSRFLNGQDTESISSKTWTPMLNLGFDKFSDPTNPNDAGAFMYATYPYYGLLPTSGNTTSSNSSAVVTGVGTSFGTDIKVGWYVNMLGNSTFSESTRQVKSIANTTQLTLSAPFNGNYTGQPLFVVPPPTTAWMSNSAYTQLANSSGAWVNATGGAVSLVTANTTSNIITGANTNFTVLLPGQIINIGPYKQAIVSIANSTQLTVEKPWADNYTNANGYIVTPNGLSYLNSNNNIYTTFNRFQIKVCVQSDDSSKVPILQDITALALQL